MTDEKFTELVNLYLDKEISDQGIAALKRELETNTERKAEFTERCRLHQAMRLAMDPFASKGSRSSPKPAVLVSPEFETPQNVVSFPRWIVGGALAACFALACMLLAPVVRDTTVASSRLTLASVGADEAVAGDPLDTIGRAEIRRFAAIKEQRNANRRASIAAQLRLMGLRPEFTPEEKHLRSLSAAAAKRPMPIRNDAELLTQVQKLSPIPSQQILRVESLQAEPVMRWPGGFHSSLASFKSM